MLSNTARFILSRVAASASFPVNSSNCNAACPTNMSSPLASSHPTSFASLSSFVSSGLYTASKTTSNPPAAIADLGVGV